MKNPHRQLAKQPFSVLCFARTVFDNRTFGSVLKIPMLHYRKSLDKL